MGYKDAPKEYQFKPGQSGNPAGRPKGKSLKEYSREYLASMTEEDRVEFLNTLSPEVIWKMAEGNPQDDITSGGERLPIPILNVFPNNSDKKDSDPKEEN